ncbi:MULTISPECIES: MATE family efflux transporter [unclassified Corallococcus]|uniref:MATE family efflux transporter n=1 Tax=unclassified Corallococcus TaxID=2685029 RepID=UPI001A8C5B8D|nr:MULTISPECIES: MATE family efflux transporter [unclassified Corallococcus]MBN9681017.1 MATE family efflux transporter [Corallococcus sp. NCSPR001]WAS87388.1 MATE family efflux transporter [Corallococcus sp. NCRR]
MPPEAAEPSVSSSPPAGGTKGELRALLRLAIPLCIAQAGQSLMSVTDTFIVGRAGTSALAAVGLSHALFFAVSSFGMGLMMGVDPLVSQAIGAGNPRRARDVLWQGVWLSAFVGVVLWAVLITVPSGLPWVGVAEEQIVQVRAFLHFRAPSLPLMLIFLTVRAYLQAIGTPRPLVVSAVLANIINVMLVPLFVFGGASLPAWAGPLTHVPAMGAAGAALSTLLCTALEVLIVARAVQAIPVPGTPSRKPVKADQLRAFRVGLPIGLHIAAEVGVFALAGVLSAKLGPESVGAHQIAISFASLTFTMALGIGNAGSVRVGWAVGAHDTPQARRSGLMAFALGAVVMSLGGLVFALFPRGLARLAGAPEDVLPLLLPLLMVSAIFQIFDGVQGVGAGVLRGAGQTRFTFLANIVGHYAVGLPLTLLLGFHLGMGVLGIWWGLCAGLISVAAAVLWRFWRVSAGTLRPLEG